MYPDTELEKYFKCAYIIHIDRNLKSVYICNKILCHSTKFMTD